MVKSHENPNPLNVLEVLHFIKDASLPAHPGLRTLNKLEREEERHGMSPKRFAPFIERKELLQGEVGSIQGYNYCSNLHSWDIINPYN